MGAVGRANTGGTWGTTMGLGKFVPYKWRWFHRWWAAFFGYFWIPCPVCGKPFGGHEWRVINGLSSSVWIPDETGDYTMRGICPKCTAAGHGFNVKAPKP